MSLVVVVATVVDLVAVSSSAPSGLDAEQCTIVAAAVAVVTSSFVEADIVVSLALVAEAVVVVAEVAAVGVEVDGPNKSAASNPFLSLCREPFLGPVYVDERVETSDNPMPVTGRGTTT